MFGRYLRKQGGSAAEKRRGRKQQLEGSKRWNFQLVIEVMLRLALLLLGYALALYLWTMGVILTFTPFGGRVSEASLDQTKSKHHTFRGRIASCPTAKSPVPTRKAISALQVQSCHKVATQETEMRRMNKVGLRRAMDGWTYSWIQGVIDLHDFEAQTYTPCLFVSSL